MRRAPSLLLLALAACPKLPEATLHEVASFDVTVAGVYTRSGSTRAPLDVVTRCAAAHGGQGQVPLALRGTRDCRYRIPQGEIEIDLTATAVNAAGEAVPSFANPVTFRVVPGQLSGPASARWTRADAGVVTATVRAVHQYGEARVWVEDAPAELPSSGGQASDAGPPEPQVRTYATGVTPTLYFDDQTLQSLQVIDNADNRSSPFVGDFVVVGRSAEAGGQQLQSCADDATHDGQPLQLVVTGLDPSGFFVTDLSACRLVDPTTDTHQAAEPLERCLLPSPDGGVSSDDVGDGGVGLCALSHRPCHAARECRRYLPGTYASMFVYNYNYPDGLYEGDLLATLSGAVQEFTSTTQMVFPAWTVAEHVRTLPLTEWTKWSARVPVTPVTYRTCGLDDVAAPFLTDRLCGHSRRNLKLESLESSLVKLRNVRLPSVLADCDTNGDGTVPFFCEQTDPSGAYFWGSCAFGEVEPPSDRVERECHQACAVGAGAYAGTVCTEASSYRGFGQYLVELGMPGLAAAGLDDSIAERYQLLEVPAADAGVAVRATGFGPGDEVAVACSGAAHVRVGGSGAVATQDDPLVPAGAFRTFTLAQGESAVALLARGEATRCSVGLNARARILVITKDAVPELSIECRVDDTDPAEATRCRALRAATFDVTGHLRHVQPARPRWAVVPRSPDDVCCHPGEGLTCPKPIKTCP